MNFKRIRLFKKNFYFPQAGGMTNKKEGLKNLMHNKQGNALAELQKG